MFSFFKTESHNRFNFRPRYYDPIKEEIEQREASIKRELGIEDAGEYKPSINRGSMKSYISERSMGQKSSNIRLIIIICILSGIAAWLILS